MTIEIVGKAPAKKYEITCTDSECRNIIRFTADDVTTVTRSSSMGRDAGSVKGISCPDCRQVLPLAEAREIQS